MKNLLPWFLGLSIILMTISIVSNIFQMMKAQNRMAAAQAKVAMLDREQQQLIQDKTQQQSTTYIESQIRNNLKLVKPGETLVVVPSQLKQEEEETVYKYTPGQEKETVEKRVIDEWKELIL